MEKLWTQEEIMARYGWGAEYTARKAREEMRHIGKGKNIRVPESALLEWEQKNTASGTSEIREQAKRKDKMPKIFPAGPRTGKGKHLVPRTREEALKMYC